MKTSIKQIVAYIFSALILFQGCTVYNSVPVSIDHAVQHELKVKVRNKDGEKFKFKRIGLENGNYYGAKKVKGTIIKTPLNKKAISSIKEKDEFASNLVIGLVLLPIIILAIFQYTSMRHGTSYL